MQAYEREMLTILCEECAELQQVICKALRHGIESCNPNMVDAPSNRVLIQREAGDVLALLDILIGYGTLSMSAIGVSRNSKPQRMKQYVHERASVEVAKP